MTREAHAVNLIATFSALEGHQAEVLRLITEYGTVVRAEPGNERFEVYTDQASPNDFVIVERYRDQSAFDAHLNTDIGRQFNATLTPLIAGDGSALQFLRRH